MHKKVLFVSSGNTIRSLIAECVAKNYIKSNPILNTQISFSSAGINPQNLGPTWNIIKDRLAFHNIDISNHTPRALTQELVDNSDVIIGMTQSHLLKINQKFGHYYVRGCSLIDGRSRLFRYLNIAEDRSEDLLALSGMVFDTTTNYRSNNNMITVYKRNDKRSDKKSDSGTSMKSKAYIIGLVDRIKVNEARFIRNLVNLPEMESIAALTWSQLKLFHKNPPTFSLFRKGHVQSKYDSYLKSNHRLKIFTDNSLYKLQYNDFPYAVAEGIDHMVLWLNPDVFPASLDKSYDLVDAILKKELNCEYIFFQNIPGNSSIPYIPHFQVFTKVNNSSP